MLSVSFGIAAGILARRQNQTRNESKLGIEPEVYLRQNARAKATTKRRANSEAEILDHATSNLMRALKQDMRKKDGRVDCEKIRKEGYSDRLLAKLEAA